MSETPRFELACCEMVLLNEIGMPEMHQRDIAKTYALAIRSSDSKTMDWSKVNKAIVDRWSLSGLKRIKGMAWSGSCFDE